MDVLLKQPRAGDAVAYEIRSQQVLIVSSQKILQARHLTGGAGEENGHAVIQHLFDGGERVSRVALDVFGTAAFKEQLRVGYDYLLGAKIPVQHAAYRQSSFVKGQIRQGGKGASAGAVCQNPLIPVNGGVYFQRLPVLRGIVRGAYLPAPAAADACFRVDMGIEKSLVAWHHGNGMDGTDLLTGSAAGAQQRIG